MTVVLFSESFELFQLRSKNFFIQNVSSIGPWIKQPDIKQNLKGVIGRQEE